MTKIDRTYPIVMAGGKGSRLWPLSSTDEPKQFLKFGTKHSLFQRVMHRLQRNFVLPITIVTTQRHLESVRAHCEEIGVTPLAIIVEPEGKGTSIAYAVASAFVSSLEQDAKMFISPVDGHFEDENLFDAVVRRAVLQSEPGRIGLIGIEPTHAHTGFGYIVPVNDGSQQNSGTVDRFVEKPDEQTARDLITVENAHWNSGILVTTSDTLLQAVRETNFSGHRLGNAAINHATRSNNVLTLPKTIYDMVDSGDFEKQTLCHQQDILYFSYGGKWSDIGTYTAIGDLVEPDSDENVLIGRGRVFDSQNCTVVSPDIPVAVAGLQDLIVSVRKNQVLVADKSHAQDIKTIANLVEEDTMTQLNEENVRPWGEYHILLEGTQFKVKEIRVNPGGVLSLQAHKYRSEHWTIVTGEGVFHLDGVNKKVVPNDTVHIPVGGIHRISNPTDDPLTFIEVQCGPYLGEDDIIRFEDVYDRTTPAGAGPDYSRMM